MALQNISPINDQLADIITRDCLIGVALPTPGVTTNIVTKTRSAIRPIAN